MSRAYQKLFICLGAILLSASNGLVAFGQMPKFQLLTGKEPPSDGRPGMWFHDPNKAGRISAFHGGEWVDFELTEAKHPQEKNGFVWIKTGPVTVLATVDGRLLIRFTLQVQELGAIVVGVASGGDVFAVRRDGDTLSYFSNIQKSAHIAAQQLEDGTSVFCLPIFVHGTENEDAWERRGWGMLDGRGQWRIPPIFDDFFQFEDGRAHVMHYGKLRMINERGEFVD